ncbi:MAG: nicotinate-nucleotide adenylyltransferase [Gammaproteobacteria bacterium]|jgi:nicotinate-nucleotide adenylyltransferase
MLGLLGGTFDPIHVAHLRLAIEVRERLALDEVRLMPAPNPRLRDAPQVAATTRLRLLRAAVEGIPGLCVDDRELRVSGPTRTVETLRKIRDEHSSRSLCLIIGADAAARLDLWYQWEQLIELAHLVIACRPGATLPSSGAVADLIKRHTDTRVAALAERRAGVIHVCEIPGLDISATTVRDRLANDRSVEFLVPERVRLILLKEKLYAKK